MNGIEIIKGESFALSVLPSTFLAVDAEVLLVISKMSEQTSGQ